MSLLLWLYSAFRNTNPNNTLYFPSSYYVWVKTLLGTLLLWFTQGKLLFTLLYTSQTCKSKCFNCWLPRLFTFWYSLTYELLLFDYSHVCLHDLPTYTNTLDGMMSYSADIYVLKNHLKDVNTEENSTYFGHVLNFLLDSTPLWLSYIFVGTE